LIRFSEENATIMTNSVPANWRDLPGLPVNQASTVLGGSTARVYKLLLEDKLTAVRVAGKVMVQVPSIVALLDQGEPWSPDPVIAARSRRAQATMQEQRRLKLSRKTRLVRGVTPKNDDPI
jgi:hypothetical protein